MHSLRCVGISTIGIRYKATCTSGRGLATGNTRNAKRRHRLLMLMLQRSDRGSVCVLGKIDFVCGGHGFVALSPSAPTKHNHAHLVLVAAHAARAASQA